MKKYLFKISAILLLIVIIYACRRTVQAEENNTVFDANAAKEWYYSVFKKSSQWALGKSKNGIKLPDWSKPKEYKIGEIEVIEYPLLQEKKVRRFMDNSMTNEERNKMFNATIDKVLFLKMSNGNIKVRIVQITPDLDYLKNKNYDISNNSFTSLDKNFSGTLKMFKWDGKFTKGFTYNNGKVINEIVKISLVAPNLKVINGKTYDNGDGDMICDYHVDYCYLQTCFLVIYGDGMVTNECDEPVLDHIDYYEYNCHTDPCAGDNFTEECFCENYSLCDGENDEVDNFFNEEDLLIGSGNKPLFEYSNKCTGMMNIWNDYPNNEVYGYITKDNKLIVTNIVSYNGGGATGLYKHEGTYYYTYPENQGAPTENYAGMIHIAGRYFIPIAASLHTHSPCRSDGTNGVSDTVGDDDQALATKYPDINHWVIGCGSIAQFKNDDDFFNIITKPLSSSCESIR